MKIVRAAAIPALLSLSLVTACGPSSSTAASTSTTNASSAASATDSASASNAAATPAQPCPTTNTAAFAKTRFATDIGLAAGTFHRYLWKPYQAGTFAKGANGRVSAIVKGGATAAFDVKMLMNAEKNVKANPTLCKVLYAPITEAVAELGNAKTSLLSGDLHPVKDVEAMFKSIESGSTSGGVPITESSDESQSSAA